jgi:hypothetical protein
MTIGYAPLDPVDAPAPLIAPRRPMGPTAPIQKFMDGSECNYLVMFFVFGVLGLAVKDMLKK